MSKSSAHKTGSKTPQTSAPARPTAEGSRKLLERPAVHLLLLALVAVVAYANTFHAPFVLDDDSSIVNNPVIKDLADFLSGAGYAYNPRRFAGYLSFALNYRFGGLHTTGYHAVNLAIHVLAAWLVYCLGRLTLKTPFFQFHVSGETTTNLKPEALNFVPLLAALLFVAHPVQTQAVTYIVQRLSSLATLFFLIALVLYVQGRLAIEQGEDAGFSPFTVHRSPFILFPLALIAAVLAMRTKEIAATLPLVVVLYEFSFFRASPRKKLLFLAPLLLVVLIVPLGMIHAGKPLGELLSDVSEMTRETRVITRGEYLLTQFSVIATYLRLLVFPVNQNLDYDYPIYDSLFAPPVLFSFLLLLVLFAVAIYLYHRTGREDRDAKEPVHRSPFTGLLRLIAFGILWFFITLSVESSIIPIRDVIFEHRLYLPSVGAFIAVAALAALFLKNARTAITASSIVVLGLAVATWHRNLVWEDAVTLWTDVTEKSPGKDRPHNNLGKYLVDRRRLDEAIPHFQTAVKLNPENFEALYNLGYAYLKKGETDLAIGPLRHAVEMQPDNAEARFRLGSALANKGETGAASECYRLAAERHLALIQLHGNDMDAHFKLALVYQKQGRLDDAIAELEKTLALNPDHAEAHNNLGVAYGMKGVADAAIEHLQAAVRLDPDDPAAHGNLANAYDMKGQRELASEQRQLAQNIRQR